MSVSGTASALAAVMQPDPTVAYRTGLSGLPVAAAP